MNTYLLPYECDGEVLLAHTIATNRNDAEERFADKLCTKYELDIYTLGWENFVKEAKEYDILLGDIYDIDEF